MKTVKMSNYSVSKEGYPHLERVCRDYNYDKVVLVGGKRALQAASPKIREALKNSDVEITGEFVYGEECTMSNVERLKNREEVQNADVIFTIGGGKSTDTGKILAAQLNKNAFSFPTICSNCSAVTAISVVYNDDRTFSHYELIPAPVHMFVETSIIANAPEEYLWAGIGDGLSKQPEVAYATKYAELDHIARMGLTLSKSCEAPFLKYGKQAIEDCRNNKSTQAIEEIAMDILVATGYVSNLTNQPEYYYNSSLAHIFYNASTAIPREKEYLHGELVSFGVLVLHAYAEQFDELDKIARFNKSIGLPITLEDVGLTYDDLEKMAEAAPNTTEWKSSVTNPLTKERFIEAMKTADEYGKKLKEERQEEIA
ncbi:MAG: iron-containing alcohol dehydrogenase family protein [Peptoniphilus sp.]|uniref:iron-containing alcohol dehydrogenase family protein n=1 Tax=Peptoniphilus sp. TaxID=1971214 RepID=UPI002A74F6DB|nr:iron-containing alcohol dehydrogenase family protein [Peptoniphilus sp.]MDY2987084.1 iron-containing alcohol dehydrogenase family protein [Peptoniphilus sp.]